MRIRFILFYLLLFSLPGVVACSEEVAEVFPGSEEQAEPEGVTGSFQELTGSWMDGAPFLAFSPVENDEGKEPDQTGGIFADLDGDGWPEVVFGNTRCCDPSRGSRVARYDREAGKLDDAPDLTESIQNHTLGMIQGAFDVTGDGFLDLLTNDPLARILPGDGAGGWLEPIPLPSSPVGLDVMARTGVPAPMDLDQDGWLDLIVADDSCQEGGRSITPLLKTGLMSWEDRSDLVLAEAMPGRTYAVLSGRFGADERFMVFSVSESCQKALPNLGFFGFSDDQKPWDLMLQAMDPTPFESLFKTMPGVSWGPLSMSEPMGAAMADVDEDGSLDLLVTIKRLGSPWSGVPTVVVFETTSIPFFDNSMWLDFVSPLVFEKGNNRRMTPWGLSTTDLDRDGHSDLVVAHGATLEEVSLDFPETPIVWINRGEKGFVDVTESVGMQRWGQWRSLAVGDLENDGKADLIVGGYGNLPLLFRNELSPGNHGIGIRLRGTTSNHLGVGAIVQEVLSDDVLGPPHLMGHSGSPVIVSEPMVFLGLSDKTKLDHVRITWPSGLIQDIRDLAADQIHTVEEPPLFLLEPVGRHLPADGVSEARLVITPRDESGAIRETDDISVVLVDGTGEVLSPTVDESGARVVSIKAPAQAGSAVLEVTIDGVTARIWPRLWWDAP